MKNYKYDFVLFENFIGAINHYKDILIIAKMLKFAGYKVAILNYCQEKDYCKNNEFPIIEIKNKFKQPDVSWKTKNLNYILKTFCLFRFLIQQNLYAGFFIKQIKGISKNYYIGSYHISMSNLFFTKSSNDSNYFMWGLRSSRMKSNLKMFYREPVSAIKTFQLSKQFIKRNNFNFFVSNQLIKNEFLELGIEKKRLILRLERFIDNFTEDNYHLLSEHFTILTIGYLRSDKRLDFSINVVNQLKNDNIGFIIAGRSDEGYNKLINNHISGNNKIIRIDKFLDEEEYENLICQSHFLLLSDKKQTSLVTNGTMLEALILNRPIIAPDYLPYSFYVREYNIGLLFDPEDENSLKIQILKAKELGVKSFIPGLKRVQTTLLFDEIINEFSDDIISCLNRN